MEVIREELELIRDTYADERQTEIREASADINLEDLINEEDVVVTLSHEGYCKYQPLTDYQAQRRGGRGKSATKMKDEDFIEKLLVANTHDTILCFSDRGRLYWLKVYQLPLASRQSRGRPIINILPLEADEKITTILPVQEYEADKFVFMATANGTVKKTALTEYSRPRANGIIAVNLNEGDRLIGASITNGDDEIMLFSENGKVVRFHENQVRSMGRTATGVRGIKLTDEAKVVSLIVPNHEDNILTITENGFGKRTPQHEYPAKSRATQGVVSIKVSERNGLVVGACQVADTNEIMIISNKGTLVRTRVDEVSVVGRNTQGVRLIRTIEGESVVGLAKIEEIEVDDELEGIEGSEGEALESESTSIESSDSANEVEGSEGDTSEE
jgi:DNA gyrase subunit A